MSFTPIGALEAVKNQLAGGQEKLDKKREIVLSTHKPTVMGTLQQSGGHKMLNIPILRHSL